MAIKFGSILHLNNSASEATLDSNNLKGTTLQIDRFNSASLATIGAGLSTSPGKRRLGTIIATTGSAAFPVEYYAYIQTSSGDVNLSGSEWTTLSNWEPIISDITSTSVSGAIDIATGSLSASLSANTFKTTGQRSGNSGITGSLELSGTGHITASGNISASGIGTFASLDISGDIDVDGTTNLDAVDIDGDVQLDGSLTIGVNVGSGYDFKLYGNTTNKFIAWDASMNQLKVHDNTKLVFGSGQAEVDFDGAIYWDQTDLVIDSETDLQISSSVNVEGNITASGNISSSGNLFALVEDNDSSGLKTVIYDTATGKFFRTGSYGGGDGGGGSDSDWYEGSDFISASKATQINNNSLLINSGSIGASWGFGSSYKNSVVGSKAELYTNQTGTTDWGYHGKVAKNVLTHVTAVANAPVNTRLYPTCLTGKPGLSQPSPPLGLNEGYPYNDLKFHPEFWYGTDGGGGGDPYDPNGDTGVPTDDEPGGMLHIGGGIEINDLAHQYYQLGSGSLANPTGSYSASAAVVIRARAGILFFETGSSLSPSGSYLAASASALIGFSTSSKHISIAIGTKAGGDLKEVLFISKSGNNPRIGVGTSTPKGAFDFKETLDSTTGTELLLRTSRTTEGGLVGDEGGSINFIIDSSSFIDIKTSGSIAKIGTKVTSVGSTGVEGKLVFTLSKGALEYSDVIEYGYGLGSIPATIGAGPYTTVQTASLVIKDFSPTGESILYMKNFADNVSFSVIDGDVEMSGSLGVTGSAIFNNNITASANISASGQGIFDTIDVKSSITGSYPKLTDSAGDTIFKISGVVQDYTNKLEMGDVDNSGTGEVLILDNNSDNPIFYNTPAGTIKWGINNNPQNSSAALTVAGDISASGTITAGDLSLTGEITASGNISASGTIVGSNLSGTNTGDQDLGTYMLSANTASFAVTSSNVLFGAITASGNISSSLNIHANQYYSNNNLILQYTNDSSNVGYIASPTHIHGTSISLNADVTASGNISSSGMIVADNFKSNNHNVANFDGTTIGFGYENTTPIRIGKSANPTTFMGNITASGVLGGGHISASGTITAENITVASDLTVTGDITANGNIVGDDGTDITNIESIFCNRIFHDDDLDTSLVFGTNELTIKAGNTSVFESTITGSILPNVHQNIYDTGSVALAADSAIGDIVKFGGSTTVAGGMYYLKGDGTWALTQANAVGKSTSSIAIAVGTNSTTHGMCLRGFINPYSDPEAGTGNPVYMSDTETGRMLATAPSSTGDIVRIIGYQYGPNLIYFNPSNDYIVHA